MKKIITAILISLFVLLPAFSSDDISFSGGESRISLKEGREEVTLTGGAVVTVDTLKIESEEITLSGKDWSTIRCTGKVRITDSERGIEILTSSLYFDRVSERLLISTYFELSDTESEMTATSSGLEYRMKEEMLTLSRGVELFKMNGDELIRAKAEKLTYSRNDETLELRGRAEVTFKGNEYRAEAISLDVKNDRITLSENIRGAING